MKIISLTPSQVRALRSAVVVQIFNINVDLGHLRTVLETIESRDRKGRKRKNNIQIPTPYEAKVEYHDKYVTKYNSNMNRKKTLNKVKTALETLLFSD